MIYKVTLGCLIQYITTLGLLINTIAAATQPPQQPRGERKFERIEEEKKKGGDCKQRRIFECGRSLFLLFLLFLFFVLTLLLFSSLMERL